MFGPFYFSPLETIYFDILTVTGTKTKCFDRKANHILEYLSLGKLSQVN
jgi:hypothetical protein